MLYRVVSVLALLLLLGSGLHAAPLRVFVSIPPQKTFVRAIGQDLVQVEVMVNPGANPATYEPKPSQMAALAETKLYLAIGVPFEKAWLPRIKSANPDLRIVHTNHNINKRVMAATQTQAREQSAPAEDASDHHGIKDPHIWLSPPLVRKQARAIGQALQAQDPEHAEEYAAHLHQFEQRIDTLHTELQNILKPVQGRSFMVFHPAWGYFARTYGLTQVPVELEGKEPKPSQLAELVAFARKENIRAIFVQPQFSSQSAQVIAREIGAEVITADPLARDWAESLRRQARRIRQSLRGDTP